MKHHASRNSYRWKVEVIDCGEDGEGDGASERNQPNGGDDARGAPQPSHGVRVQRVANGQVAFCGERHDRHHRRVRSAAKITQEMETLIRRTKLFALFFNGLLRFGDECSEFAEALAQLPRVLMPVDVQIVGQTCEPIREQQRSATVLDD